MDLVISIDCERFGGDQSGNTDIKYYDHILALGATDGFSGKAEKSVDGFGIDKTEEILNALKA